MSNRHVQNLRHLLRTDYHRYLKYNHYDLNNLPGLINSIGLMLRSPGIVAVFIQRLDYLNFSWYGDKGFNLMKYDLRIVLFILNYFKRTIFKIAIPKTVNIGPGLVISGRGVFGLAQEANQREAVVEKGARHARGFSQDEALFER